MNRKLWENIGSLYGVQLFSYVLPLFTLPYLARALGPAAWGTLAFADAFANYLSIFVEYGFGLSATREVATARHDKLSLSRQVAKVLGAQAALWITVGAASLPSVYFINAFRPYLPLLPAALLLGGLRAIVPIWYFQGIEQMRFVSAVILITNAAAAALSILLIHSPNDAWISIAARAVAAAASCIFAFAAIYRQIPPRMPTMESAWAGLREGKSLFVLKGAISLYTTANVLLVGLLGSPSAVAWYAGAEKITRACSGVLSPISQAFYPRINYLLKSDRIAASNAARISLYLTAGTGIFLAAGLIVGAPLAVTMLLGKTFRDCVPVLRLLAPVIPLVAVNTVLGIQWMVPLRLESLCNRIVLVAGLINIAGAIVLVPRFHDLGMAASVLLAELSIAISMAVTLSNGRKLSALMRSLFAIKAVAGMKVD